MTKNQSKTYLALLQEPLQFVWRGHLLNGLGLVASVVLVAGCATGRFVDTPQAKEGIAASDPVITEVEAYKQIHGKYPESIDLLGLSSDALTRVKAQGVSYYFHSDGNAYGVMFRFPAAFGALSVHCHYGNTSIERVWQCLGK